MKSKKPLIIGIDFDDTIVHCRYPYIGPFKFMAKASLKWLQKRHILILWTCREGALLNKAKTILLKEGIRFDFYNKNDARRILKYGGDCRKLSCDLLIDDKAGFVWWPWIVLKVLWMELRRGLSDGL